MNNEIPPVVYLVSSFPTNPKCGGFPWDIIQGSQTFQVTGGSIPMDCYFSPVEQTSYVYFFTF